MEKASTVGLAKLHTLWGFEAVMRLLAFNRSAEFDCRQYIGQALPFLSYSFETWRLSDAVSTGVQNRPRMSGEFAMKVPTHRVILVQEILYESVKGFELY